MGAMDAVLAIAQGELGVSESGAPDRVGAYLRVVDLPADPKIPWCAAFTCWLLEQAGMGHPHAANARAFLKWGVEGTRVPGNIAVFRRGEDEWTGHVGIVSPRDDPAASPDRVLVISGNHGDKVAEAYYPVGKLLGYRAPKSMGRSRVVAAATAGVVADAGAEALSEPDIAAQVLATANKVLPVAAEPSLIGAVRAVLVVLVVGAMLYVIYDRFLKNKAHGI